MLLGDAFPNFTANTTEGKIDFYDWLGDSWGILFSHPSDFTPVCTTELARMITLYPEFVKRNIKVIGLSCDSISSHHEWSKDIKKYADIQAALQALDPDSTVSKLVRNCVDYLNTLGRRNKVVLRWVPGHMGIEGNELADELARTGAKGCGEDEKFPYPIIEDKERQLALKLGMIDKDEVDSAGMPLTARCVFIVDSKKKFRLSILYPATTGRSFDEILRVTDSLQLTDKMKVATPVDWKLGDDCMVLPTIPEDQISEMFPQGVTVVPLPSGKKYLRKTSWPIEK